MSAAVMTPKDAPDVRTELREIVRTVVRDPAHGSTDELVRVLARLDLYGLLVGPEHGGVGASLGSALVVLEELAAAGRADAYLHDGVLAPSLLRYFGSQGAVPALLERVVAGRDHVAALVDGGVDDRWLVDVVGTGPAACLTGRGRSLPTGTRWTSLVVLVRDGLRPALVVVPADAPGVRFETAADPSGREVTSAVLDGVPLPGCLVAPLRAGDADDIATLTALTATARLVGAARRSFDLTLSHVRTRQQFGRPIAGFQAVQMRCADLARDVDSSDCVFRRAVTAAEAGRPDRHLLASMAALWSGEACVRATQTAHLLHGALGFTAEFELHRHSVTALDARLSAPVNFHRRRVARLLSNNSSDRSDT